MTYSSMRQTGLILSVLLTLMSLSLTRGTKPPNILLMMADDLGIGDIGCFGNDTIRTPNIDGLAKEGVRLNHDLAAAAICTPSRAAFQTGRYPIRMGMVAYHPLRVHMFPACSGGLPSSERTLGEVAKSRGYKTGFIGKWHLGMNCEKYGDFCHHPLNQGYDYFYGMPISNAKDFGDDGLTLFASAIPHLNLILVSIAVSGALFAYSLVRFGLFGRLGFTIVCFMACFPWLFYHTLAMSGPRLSGMVMRDFDVVEQPIRLPGFTDRLIKEGVGFLQDRQKDDAPFLLVMSWLQVHTALHATKPFSERSVHGQYGDEVEEMDWSVGEILKVLDTLGLKNNTFVYFTSDHGGHLEEKGVHGNQEGGWNGIYKGGKTQGGMEGGIRVPTVIRWPGVVPAGSVVDVPTSHMDINPTVARIVGAELPKDRIMDGKDIVPVLKAQAGAARPHEFLVHYCGDRIHSARYTPGDGSDVYKVFYATHNYIPGTYQCHFTCLCGDRGVTWHDPPIMYNVARDPSENAPLDVSVPANQRILAEITNKLELHKNSLEDVESQFTVAKFVPRPWLQMCCNFPYCTCKEDMSTPPRKL